MAGHNKFVEIDGNLCPCFDRLIMKQSSFYLNYLICLKINPGKIEIFFIGIKCFEKML